MLGLPHALSGGGGAARLAELAQAETGLRLRLGQVLEVLGRGKHFELGFSSVAAYVLERCDRSVRWVEAARCLARRLEALPKLRRAMALGGACGSVAWSMGELFLRFVCLSMWQAWRHLLGADVAYGQIYIRDRYRCTSPVCSRKDVTPHHLQFRSAGGSDEPANTTSVCTWCHLCGVHGGRIRAAGSAELIHWELGPPRSPCLVVHGRERVAA